MDPWDVIRKASRDRRSGAAEIAVAAARSVSMLDGKREIMRAARMLLRAHPAMAPLWNLFAAALAGDDVDAFSVRLSAETDSVAHAAVWAIGRRAVVLTHSSSSSVVAALRKARKRIDTVLCCESRPGGEGRTLARRLGKDGFVVEVVPDAAVVQAAERADVVLVGADAVTEDGCVNNIGTYSVALAARELGTPCYALAGTTKFIVRDVWALVSAPLFEQTPIALFDGVVSERGVLSAAAVRRAVRKVEIPSELMKVIR
ncbi:MAG: hypothetical protein ABR548_04250 [Actinomycetota bacterium]|nr:hypothetical protein [Actinomycetota bacterium]